MAGSSERYLRTGRSGNRQRLCWNFNLWYRQTCADSVWSSPCILYAILADSSRWYYGNCRTDSTGRTEYLFCTACWFCKCSTFQRRCNQIFLRWIYLYDLRSSGSSTGNVPLRKTWEEKSSRRTSSFRSTGMYVYRYHRATGILIPVRSSGTVCSAGNSGRCGLYDRTYAEYRSRTYFFRWFPWPVPVWNPSGKYKDKLAENHSGGYYLFHSVLCDLYIYDQEIWFQNSGTWRRRYRDKTLYKSRCKCEKRGWKYSRCSCNNLQWSGKWTDHQRSWRKEKYLRCWLLCNQTSCHSCGTGESPWWTSEADRFQRNREKRTGRTGYLWSSCNSYQSEIGRISGNCSEWVCGGYPEEYTRNTE